MICFFSTNITLQLGNSFFFSHFRIWSLLSFIWILIVQLQVWNFYVSYISVYFLCVYLGFSHTSTLLRYFGNLPALNGRGWCQVLVSMHYSGTSGYWVEPPAFFMPAWWLHDMKDYWSPVVLKLMGIIGYRAGDHVTFVYGNIVSQQMDLFAIFFIYLLTKSINLYRSCSKKTNSDSSGLKLSNIAFVFFYLCLHKLVIHIFNKKILH